MNRDYYKGIKDVSIFIPRFDKRLEDTKDLLEDTSYCMRQYVELIIDNWGNGHLCCQDWRGDIKLGNVVKEDFQAIVERRYRILEQMKRDKLPVRCLKCRAKVHNLPSFDLDSRNRAIKYDGTI